MQLKTEGIVLRVRNLGEADRIVTIYTASHGKIRAVARGARRIRNRLLSPTQLFTQGRYLIFLNKGLHNLSQGEIVHSGQVLRDDLDMMATASYVTELLDVLTDEEYPSPAIYDLLKNTLSLGEAKRFSLAVRSFEIRLMVELGYEPQLYNCLNCGVEVSEKISFTKDGGVVCSACQNQFSQVVPLSNGTWELMKRLTEWELSRLSILHPSEVALGELERIMRNYIDFRLDYPLKSLAFLKTLQSTPALEVKKGES